jgi:hypothetical protein
MGFRHVCFLLNSSREKQQRERNVTKLMTGIAISTLLVAAPALAQDSWKDKQKDQLLYQQQQKMLEDQASPQAQPGQEGAIGQTKPNSGPGVQGPADTRTGPATKSPGGSADAQTGGSASTGASSGESGSSATQPSQDSSGVQGFPDTRTGPSTKSPDDSSMKEGAK